MRSNSIDKNNGLSVLSGTLYALSNLTLKRILRGKRKVYLCQHQHYHVVTQA